jgi:hypothetical protein
MENLGSTGFGTIVATGHYKNDSKYSPPAWAVELTEKRKSNPPKSLHEYVVFQANIAEQSFNQFGNHMAMLWLLNEEFESIDYIATIPEDQAYKFIFWRMIADRIHYLKAKSLIWVCESWLRSGVNKHPEKAIRNLPITGEVLSVTGIDGKGSFHNITWEIERDNKESQPKLKLLNGSDERKIKEAYYLIPAKKALELATTKTD